MGWLMRQACDHKHLSKVTTRYCEPSYTCTAIDYEIICPRCGLVFVDKQNYKRISEIIRNQSDER